MKIVIADPIAPAGVDFLKEQADCEVVEAVGLSPEQLAPHLADAEGIAVRSETKVTAALMDAAPHLKVVGRAGVGVDNIDIETATERGIVVMNTPGGNTVATAELTFSHLLCSFRPLPRADRSMKEGRWDRKVLSGAELQGKVLGVCGLGRVGTEVARRALAFGMRVLAYDPFLTQSRADSLGVENLPWERVCAEADVLTVHMPLTDETRHLIDREALARMKDGVRILNCARGGIVDEEALREALASGKVAAAGLDVYESEPLPEDHPLRTTEGLVLTPHLGASTREAQENVGLEIVQQMLEALRGGMVQNALNMPSIDPRDLKVLRPYIQLGEKLGTFVQQLCSGIVERVQITYFGKIVELDAMPISRAVQRGFLRQISGESINDVNAPRKLARLGVEVEIVKSSRDSGFTELIRVQATEENGKTRTVEGSLFGLQQHPRIVSIDGHGLEVNTAGTLLVLKNEDVPGIVGFLGTTLDRDGVNIANLSLSRDPSNGYAVSVYELDSPPSAPVREEIRNHPGIMKFRVIQL